MAELAIFRECVSLMAPPRCAACGIAVREPLAHHLFCRVCDVAAERLDQPNAAFVYGGSVADAIKRFKFAGQTELARPLAGVLAGHLEAHVPDGGWGVVTHVPIHWRRRVVRGFDQASLLSAEVARRLKLPCVRHAVRRVRATRPQSLLEESARQANVAGAFARSWASLRGQHVLLIDDVITTGATMAAVAEVLRDHGCASVSIAAVAQAC